MNGLAELAQSELATCSKTNTGFSLFSVVKRVIASHAWNLVNDSDIVSTGILYALLALCDSVGTRSVKDLKGNVIVFCVFFA